MKAPAASLSGYSPDLPLLAAPSSGLRQYNNNTRNNNNNNRDYYPYQRGSSLDGRVGASAMKKFSNEQTNKQNYLFDSPELLPSLDSTEYFANFNSRPISQSLSLNFKLNKKHFMVSKYYYYYFFFEKKTG